MTDKQYIKIAIGITVFISIIAFLAILLPKESSGGEQNFFTTIAYTIFSLILSHIILLIFYLINKR
jgi:hypothetical protein